jgi:hypothetical protein
MRSMTEMIPFEVRMCKIKYIGLHISADTALLFMCHAVAVSDVMHVSVVYCVVVCTTVLLDMHTSCLHRVDAECALMYCNMQ